MLNQWDEAGHRIAVKNPEIFPDINSFDYSIKDYICFYVVSIRMHLLSFLLTSILIPSALAVPAIAVIEARDNPKFNEYPTMEDWYVLFRQKCFLVEGRYALTLLPAPAWETPIRFVTYGPVMVIATTWTMRLEPSSSILGYTPSTEVSVAGRILTMCKYNG
jgi:hypothetical protein